MKTILSEQTISIPKEVKSVTVSSRVVTVVGPRGTLTRSFKHVNAEIRVEGKRNRRLIVTMWFGTHKQIASVRTICSHITNMITGVTKGYEYKMKFVYAHFPVNVNIPADGSSIEIHNFLGEKVVRRVVMAPGVQIIRSDAKDEIILRGNSIEDVSQSAARVHQSTLVKNKDIRKFLDGIYVSEKKIQGEDA
eukprot:TRINITY_DN12234_c0_g1_i1.p1 TRINITY_DN12234_c0_g1~~TRINITY_DN12234_c0_g1_i1.p1  ORF type:complete len:192 (+),score=34.05 TRINITY_DN12234_c0_g1_i1:67-642(+)